jgi:hypothetical protein
MAVDPERCPIAVPQILRVAGEDRLSRSLASRGCTDCEEEAWWVTTTVLPSKGSTSVAASHSRLAVCSRMASSGVNR